MNQRGVVGLKGSVFQELRELDQLRFKETQRIKLLKECTERRQTSPYVHFSCLDATGVSERRAEQQQIIHWGPNGTCAISIHNNVYLVQPIVESPTTVITPCIPPYFITCVRWLDSLPADQDISLVSVLAIATNCPHGII